MPVKTGGVLNADLLPDWLSNAAKYEWKDEFGDVGPEDLELERQIFHPDLMLTAGEWVKILSEIKVHQEGPKQVKPIKSVSLYIILLKLPFLTSPVRRCRPSPPCPGEPQEVWLSVPNAHPGFHHTSGLGETGCSGCCSDR